MDQFLTVFSYLCQMSWAVLFVIPVVLLVRFVLGRVSKRLCYVLWVIVAVRLCFPVLLPAEFWLFHCVDAAAGKITAYTNPVTNALPVT
ncbi:MAG: hypothetical protein ACLT3H_04260 [Roseburia sp.]